ncbi:hypothetical protein ACXYN8_10625 [Altererythrobacter sp. CAU 1778]
MKAFLTLVAFCGITACSEAGTSEGARVAWLADANDPQVLIGNFSGTIAVRDGCVGVETAPGNFLQAVFRTRPELDLEAGVFRSVTYGQEFREGSAITGEGEVYRLDEGRKFLSDAGAAPCSDSLLIIKRVDMENKMRKAFVFDAAASGLGVSTNAHAQN